MLRRYTSELVACGKVEIGELGAITHQLLYSCVGDHLAVLEGDEFQFLAELGERLQVFISKIVAGAEIHGCKVRTIRSQSADIPSRNAIEVEEGEVGVLDDMADAIRGDVLHLMQVDGLEANSTIRQQFETFITGPSSIHVYLLEIGTLGYQ